MGVCKICGKSIDGKNIYCEKHKQIIRQETWRKSKCKRKGIEYIPRYDFDIFEEYEQPEHYCQYCGSILQYGDICSHCAEKLKIIRRIKKMLKNAK